MSDDPVRGVNRGIDCISIRYSETQMLIEFQFFCEWLGLRTGKVTSGF